MQNVGAAWLMVSLRAGPRYVALMLALPAGSAAHFVRRSLDGGDHTDSGYSDHWRLYVALVAGKH
jgi:hypothetical protein